MQKSLHLRVCLPYVLAMVQKSHILFPPDGLKFIYTLFTENANLVLSSLIWKSLCNCWVVINDCWRLKNLELTLSTNSMKIDAALMHTVHAYAHPCMHSLNFNNYQLSNHCELDPAVWTVRHGIPVHDYIVAASNMAIHCFLLFFGSKNIYKNITDQGN